MGNHSYSLRNRYLLLVDVLLLALAAYLSFVLRLERFGLESSSWVGFALFTLTAVIIFPLCFRFAGLYSRYWRYASIQELLLLTATVLLGVLLASFVSFAAAAVVRPFASIPRSIPFIFFFLALAATTGPRFFLRLVPTYFSHANHRHARPKPVLIVGAGDAGSMIVREVLQNPRVGLDPVGFIDDDADKRGARIHGVPVLGGRQEIPKLVSDYGIAQVIIAMPTAPGKAIRDIVDICEKVGVDTKIVPGLSEMLDGRVTISQLRNVEIEDLLRRESVQTDTAAVTALLAGKRVLVTGAGGSIGSELCRQIMRCAPAELIMLGHGENSVFQIMEELKVTTAKMQGMKPLLQPVIADIRFADRIQAVFAAHRPQIVFHAAAHKHVPLMEDNPSEAITNNVRGTRNVLAAALQVEVECFVLISTDKAVNPTSIMGASKRVAELLVHEAAERSGKPYVAVRFGNVLGSRGSVLHTFRRQISAGGPVTVTHPDIRRYFMTIPEAVELVLQASVLGKGCEMFMLDMGEPVRIVDLANDLIELSGLEVGSDIDIVFTGMRPGEKLFEELFIEGETYQPTQHDKIFIAASDYQPANLGADVAALIAAAEREDKDAIFQTLQTLVPEFQPAGDPETPLAPQSEPTRANGNSATSLPISASQPPEARPLSDLRHPQLSHG